MALETFGIFGLEVCCLAEVLNVEKSQTKNAIIDRI